MIVLGQLRCAGHRLRVIQNSAISLGDLSRKAMDPDMVGQALVNRQPPLYSIYLDEAPPRLRQPASCDVDCLADHGGV